MKSLFLTFLLFFSSIGICLTSIWIIVSFIVYLVKDIPFHWNSIWFFVGSVCVAIFTFFSLVVLNIREELRKRTEGYTGKRLQSGFAQKLEEIKNKRK